jgi:uncharacterized pyridoxal phosphate-containing UPF0001 family protein
MRELQQEWIPACAGMSGNSLPRRVAKQCYKSACPPLPPASKPSSARSPPIAKTFPAEAIEPVIAAGQRVFGENRVQEAKAKWPALFDRFGRAGGPAPAAAGLELHLVGPEFARGGSAPPTLFIQVNTGAEPQKAGVLPEETDAFVKACRESYGLAIAGLMCIPPLEEAPAPHFALLKKIADRNGLKLLSMGMSADYALAIRFGATHVRVGSAIFGERE